MTVNLDDIKAKVIKSRNHSLDLDFVAAAIKYDIEKEVAYHAGIAICMAGHLSIFHYNGTEILLEAMNPDKWYIDKVFDFITHEEVASFYIYCEDIKKEARPEYGFCYNGSYFKEDGTYYSDTEDFQFMSCVGFCLNVITGAIEGKQYLQHEDWEMADHEKDAYFQKYLDGYLDSVPREKRNRIKKMQRRIYPMDYFTSAFINSAPIAKTQIDLLNPSVSDAVKEEAHRV